MKQKREDAAKLRAKKRDARGSDVPPEPSAGTDEHDVYLALRTLGYRDGESRRALALCADMPDASREDKFRRALRYFPQRCHRTASFREGPPAGATPPAQARQPAPRGPGPHTVPRVRTPHLAAGAGRFASHTSRAFARL